MMEWLKVIGLLAGLGFAVVMSVTQSTDDWHLTNDGSDILEDARDGEDE